jgi:hypothetical protein
MGGVVREQSGKVGAETGGRDPRVPSTPVFQVAEKLSSVTAATEAGGDLQALNAALEALCRQI